MAIGVFLKSGSLFIPFKYHVVFREEFDIDPESTPTSKCPVELGVVKTRWGTISPGHMIAGIASSLEASTVSFQRIAEEIEVKENVTRKLSQSTNDVTRRLSQSAQLNTEINNVWVSTVVGNLAQVVLHQAFHEPAVDNEGIWNDTSYPRAHYIARDPWEMTRATLLGGIDGE